MTLTAKYDVRQSGDRASVSPVERTVEQFSQLVVERMQSLAEGNDRETMIALTERALREAQASFLSDVKQSERLLPVSRLKASDVISQGLVNLSQATLYRGVENKRFYCTTPKGRSIGREFPAWQFYEPVPELLEPVLTILAELPSSEIHAFWVTANDELNELSPAEVLAGKPFETRNEVHASQQQILAQPTNSRLRKVQQVAALHTRGMAEIIG